MMRAVAYRYHDPRGVYQMPFTELWFWHQGHLELEAEEKATEAKRRASLGK